MRTTKLQFPQATVTILSLEAENRDYLHADERGKISILNGLKLESSKEVTRKRIFSQGDIPEAKQGIFNPSAVFDGSRGKAVFRCEPSAATWRGYWIENKGVPAVADFTVGESGLNFEVPRPISSGMPLASRPEDWRIFRHLGQDYVSFTNYFYYNKGYPQATVQCRTALGRIEGDKIRFLREMDATNKGVAMNREEKNWTFFSYNGELFCIYSIEPFIVFRCTNDGEIIETSIRQTDLPRFGNRYIAQSCNPILLNIPELGGDVFAMFVHQFYSPHGRGTRNRTYYQHLFIFCPREMRPLAWSCLPIVGGGLDIEGRHNGVAYVSGMFEHNGTIYATAGEGDAHSVVYSLVNRDLMQWLDLLT